MDPARKRTIRLVIALTAAVLLASALVYTSFSAASPAVTASQLLREAQPGRSYQLTGTVVPNTISHRGDRLLFSVQDRTNRGPVLPVVYSGAVPDPFRAGREIVVTVSRQGSSFVGKRDSLVTKCPSKFQAAPNSSKY